MSPRDIAEHLRDIRNKVLDIAIAVDNLDTGPTADEVARGVCYALGAIEHAAAELCHARITTLESVTDGSEVTS